MNFEHFLRHTSTQFSDLAFLATEPSMVPLFVSNTVVPVSRETIETCTHFIRDFRHIVDHPQYRQDVQAHIPAKVSLDRPDSALLCFDFYVTPTGPKLIEINTNGAGYPSIALLYAAHHLTPEPATHSDVWENLRTMFFQEWGPQKPGDHVVIVDEDIFEQRTMFEFKTYQALFQRWGYTCDLVPMSALAYVDGKLMAMGKQVHKIYNRCCDFYLTDPNNAILAKAVSDPNVAVSPHPSSYGLMGDKGRLVTLSDPQKLRAYGCSEATIAHMQTCLPPVQSIRDKSPEDWWSIRKACFFKPQNTYGSKAVYKGASIAKKRFEELLQEDYVVQPYFEAGTTPVIHNGATTTFKYDLRFFVYQDQVLLIGARLFQGQVTNFQVEGGGFAPIQIHG